MKFFYPKSTDSIIHKGNTGNIYRLDAIERCVLLKQSILKNHSGEVELVSYDTDESKEQASFLITTAHNPNLLETIRTGQPRELITSSGFMWQPKLYDYVLEQALIAKKVVDQKDSLGSVGLTGGGHHAEKDMPYGFCPINTISIAALYARSLGKTVAIIDLDTHYSNGCIDILLNKEGISLFSIWNQTLDKWKYVSAVGNIWHKKANSIDEYSPYLDELISLVKKMKPDFIIYHLGLDVLESDRMGGISGFNNEYLLKRDKTIKKLIVDELNAKFAIFIGGAYVDRSKGEEYSKSQQESITSLQREILEQYI